ncbi:MAG: hypothetical protein R2852_02005 [Bacteroidia bacterium]
MHFGLVKYSYGWGNASMNNLKISYHDGSAGTYYCHTFLVPEKQIAIVILANSATTEHITSIYNLRESLLAQFLSN